MSSLKELKNTNFETRLPMSRFRDLQIVAPAFENRRSEGTEVAIMDNFSLAIVYKFGYMVLRTSQTSRGFEFTGTTGFCKYS